MGKKKTASKKPAKAKPKKKAPEAKKPEPQKPEHPKPEPEPKKPEPNTEKTPEKLEPIEKPPKEDPELQKEPEPQKEDLELQKEEPESKALDLANFSDLPFKPVSYLNFPCCQPAPANQKVDFSDYEPLGPDFFRSLYNPYYEEPPKLPNVLDFLDQHWYDTPEEALEHWEEVGLMLRRISKKNLDLWKDWAKYQGITYDHIDEDTFEFTWYITWYYE